MDKYKEIDSITKEISEYTTDLNRLVEKIRCNDIDVEESKETHKLHSLCIHMMSSLSQIQSILLQEGL